MHNIDQQISSWLSAPTKYLPGMIGVSWVVKGLECLSYVRNKPYPHMVNTIFINYNVIFILLQEIYSPFYVFYTLVYSSTSPLGRGEITDGLPFCITK